jgi:hypothetical protein
MRNIDEPKKVIIELYDLLKTIPKLEGSNLKSLYEQSCIYRGYRQRMASDQLMSDPSNNSIGVQC